MDEGTADQWQEVFTATAAARSQQSERILVLLRSLDEIVNGFAVDQLTHCLQTATRAERAGADNEMVVAALCHDIGKGISVPNHGAISAEILKPYVRDEVYQVIRVHQDFQGRHFHRFVSRDPDIRNKYAHESWYGLAELFADEWDQTSFDPLYDTLPLGHFEPRVRAQFAVPRVS